MDVCTAVRTAASVGHISTDVHAEHLPVLLMMVYCVTSFLWQGVEIKQMTCRRADQQGICQPGGLYRHLSSFFCHQTDKVTTACTKCVNVWPVAGLVTLQSPCWVLFRGQAAAVSQRKVYTQSSMAEIRVGRESWKGHEHTNSYTGQTFYFENRLFEAGGTKGRSQTRTHIRLKMDWRLTR